MPKPKLIPKISSLNLLRMTALTDPRYQQLAIKAANNLGGNVSGLDGAMSWLWLNVSETGSEQTVIDEVNFCRDLVK